jgi:hypothetical protein
MNPQALIALLRTSTIVTSTIVVLGLIVAPQAWGDEQGDAEPGGGEHPPSYNPYPPGILPRDWRSPPRSPACSLRTRAPLRYFPLPREPSASRSPKGPSSSRPPVT